MDALSVLQASWAVACLLVPGIVLAVALGLGRDALERIVVGAAIGRLLLALAALALAGRAALAWLPLWGAPWVLYGLLVQARRGRLPRPGAALRGPLAVVAAAILLVMCVSGRSALPDAEGSLVFFGHHTTTDPLIYTALADQLAAVGPPVPHPLVAGLPNLGQTLFFAELVGLRFAGALDPLDVAFRVRPLLDVTVLGLGALALARALGACPLGAALAGLLVLLGGGVSQLAYALLHFFEWPLRQTEVWGFGTSFLLPVNPIAPALQTAFAALLVLTTAAVPSGRTAAIAGVLVAAVFGLKVFLWPPLVAGLALATLWSPDPARRRAFAIATGMAVVAVLPALLEMLALDARLASQAVVGPAPCVGCLPRFLIDWSFGSAPLDETRLDGNAASLLDPRAWLGAAVAAGLVWVLLLGARLLALPTLWREATASGAPARAAAQRVLLGATAAGLGLSVVTTAPPHPFNALQFGWAATFPLWVVLGLALGRWVGTGRRVAAALVVALAAIEGLFWIVDQGALAPPYAALGFEERQLLATLAEQSRPGELVLEPSLLAAPHSVSPVAWLAGRPVFLSHGGAARYLPPAERARREGLLARAFDARDPEAASAAIHESGARLVYAPAVRPLPARGVPGLELLRANAAGAVFRVQEPGS